MRSCGRVVATLLLILFILHSILGATSLTGLSNIGLYPLLLAFQIILAVHIVIGAVYTYRSLHGGQINYWHPQVERHSRTYCRLVPRLSFRSLGLFGHANTNGIIYCNQLDLIGVPLCSH